MWWKTILGFIGEKVGGKELTYIMGGIFALIFLTLIVPNLDQIKEKVGLDSRASLKVTIANQKTSIEKAEEANKVLEDGLLFQDKVNAFNDAAAVNLDKKEQEREKFVEDLKTERRKVKIVTAKKGNDANVVVDTQAEADIDMVWASYKQAKGV